MIASSYVDLHSHSKASDGTLAPAEVVRLAAQQGLSAVALTDHDPVAGVAEAAAAALEQRIDFLPGIEISAEFPQPGTLHILGFGVDPQSAALRSLTEELLGGRDSRNPKIVSRLQEIGVPITMQEVQDQAAGGVVGRPHIAAVLLKKGLVNSIKQAFDVYLAPGGSAYFDKERLSPSRAIEMIHHSGGLAVLAHPSQLRTDNDAQLDRIIKGLIDLGLDGIEVLHSDHSDEQVRTYTALADRYGVLKSGGSDFHGNNKPKISLGRAGNRRVPRAFYDAIVQTLRSRGKPSV
ncbi:MAG: PHP domain-containing protein [Tepidisphaeraceae bacterium]